MIADALYRPGRGCKLSILIMKIIEHCNLPLEGKRVHCIHPMVQPHIRRCKKCVLLPNIMMRGHGIHISMDSHLGSRVPLKRWEQGTLLCLTTDMLRSYTRGHMEHFLEQLDT